MVAAMSGCSSTTNSVASQLVDDIAWLPDESALLASIEQQNISAIDGSSYYTENLYHVGTDGSIGNAYGPGSYTPNGAGYTPMVFVSTDGRTAITQFGNDIYTIDLSNGNVADIIQNTNLLAVSPNMKYVLTTTISEQQTAKVFAIYNLTTPTITLLPKITVVGVVSTDAIWTDDAHFALAISDSVANNVPYDHVAIMDTSGTVTQTIPDAVFGLNTGAYASKTGDLFFLNHALGADKFNLASGTRTSVIANDTVESFDVSADGKLLVYSSGALQGASAPSYSGYAVNVASGNKASIASGMIAPRISPNADKVAFIHEISSGSSSDVQVIGVSLP